MRIREHAYEFAPFRSKLQKPWLPKELKTLGGLRSEFSHIVDELTPNEVAIVEQNIRRTRLPIDTLVLSVLALRKNNVTKKSTVSKKRRIQESRRSAKTRSKKIGQSHQAA